MAGCLDDVTPSRRPEAIRTRGTIGLDRQHQLLRNSVKAVVDAYDGTTTFYVFDDADPIIAAYRACSRACSRTPRRCRQRCGSTCATRSCCSQLQAAVYGLYHMTNPGTFYNREDLWTVATEVGMNAQQRSRRRRSWSRTSC